MEIRQTLATLLLLASSFGARAQEAGVCAPHQGQGAAACGDSAGYSPHREVRFVSEYIRALSQTENIRAATEQKIGRSPQARLSSCVHAAQLQSQAMAKAANLAGSYTFAGDAQQTPGLLVSYYVTKGEMFRSLGNMCRTGAGTTKLRADMDDLDESLLQMSVMVFGVLTRPAADTAGPMRRLVVTRKERDSLVHQISISFKKRDARDENYIVSAATVLWEYLARKGYRCADDPA